MKQADAAKLQAYLRNWRARNPYRWQKGAQAVSDDLIQDAAFADIKVANLLETSAGVTITQVVESTLPFPGDAEAAVMVEAIEIATRKQTATQAVGILAVGVLVAVILWGLFGDR
jgi:hypothetical protein